MVRDPLMWRLRVQNILFASIALFAIAGIMCMLIHVRTRSLLPPFKLKASKFTSKQRENRLGVHE